MNKTKYCYDPKGKHKKRIYSNVRNVNENISSLVKGKFYKLHEALSNYKVKVFSAHRFFSP